MGESQTKSTLHWKSDGNDDLKCRMVTMTDRLLSRRGCGGSIVNTRILGKDYSTIMIVIMFLSGQVSVRFNICGITKTDTLLLFMGCTLVWYCSQWVCRGEGVNTRS